MKFENKTIQKTVTAFWITAEYLMAFIAYFLLMTVAGKTMSVYPFSQDAHSVFHFFSLALAAGLTVAAANLYIVTGLTKNLGFFRSLLTGTALYVLAAMTGLFIFTAVEHTVIAVSVPGYGDPEASLYLFMHIESIPLLLFLFFVSFPIRTFHLIVSRVGEKKILDTVTDRYRIPHEEERVFMFMDLYGSTAVAEKIGHARYHDLLYDVFNDISDIISRYSGEVYQYVGDAVVVTWDIRQGAKKINCVRCFFDIQSKMEELSDKYMSAYHYKPKFKAGMHAGKVIAGEVGDLKKEVVFHGDTVNTASRIQAECVAHHASLLVSEELFLLFPIKNLNELNTEFIGCLKLKGRLQDICLYRIDAFMPEDRAALTS
ncbi:MAG: adenylate/guanylate cyclase domain-containing protein [Chlorobi bacterium]|nr:adenylate/guanylate cyclase domain-containing protein [Chlorobiota bacterium]